MELCCLTKNLRNSPGTYVVLWVCMRASHWDRWRYLSFAMSDHKSLAQSLTKSPRAARGPSFDRLRTGLAKGGFWVPSFGKGGTGRISQQVPQYTNVMWCDLLHKKSQRHLSGFFLCERPGSRELLRRFNAWPVVLPW